MEYATRRALPRVAGYPRGHFRVLPGGRNWSRWKVVQRLRICCSRWSTSEPSEASVGAKLATLGPRVGNRARAVHVPRELAEFWRAKGFENMAQRTYSKPSASE